MESAHGLIPAKRVVRVMTLLHRVVRCKVDPRCMFSLGGDEIRLVAKETVVQAVPSLSQPGNWGVNYYSVNAGSKIASTLRRMGVDLNEL